MPDFDQDQYVEKIQSTINSIGAKDHIALEVISTAINVVPKVNGSVLGKSWAAGKALLHLWQHKLGCQEVGLEQVITGTIAAGDGRADLDFTKPSFPDDLTSRSDRNRIDIIFVGGRHDLDRVPSDLTDRIIIHATGEGELSVHSHEQRLSWRDARGARVISEVLEYLKIWQCFRPFR